MILDTAIKDRSILNRLLETLSSPLAIEVVEKPLVSHDMMGATAVDREDVPRLASGANLLTRNKGGNTVHTFVFANTEEGVARLKQLDPRFRTAEPPPLPKLPPPLPKEEEFAPLTLRYRNAPPSLPKHSKNGEPPPLPPQRGLIGEIAKLLRSGEKPPGARPLKDDEGPK